MSSLLITEYLTLQQKYEEMYEKAILLYQKGTFYNMWQYDQSKCAHETDKIDKDGRVWNESVGKAKEISELLEMKLTMDNNNQPYTIKNCDMFGFPCVAYDKHLKTLLQNDYTVIRMDETNTYMKVGNSKRLEHYVVEIISPTMAIEKLSTTMTTALIVVIYIEYLKAKNINFYDGYAVISGIATFDLVTGDTKVTEFYSKDNNEFHCAQEIYRFLVSHQPKEIVIQIDDVPSEMSEDPTINPYSKYLEKVLELKRYDRYNVLINKVNKDYKKLNYQIEFFNKLFSSKEENYKNEKILDTLDLSRQNHGRMAFLLLIQYCYTQNVPIANLKPPEVFYMDENKVLVLTHNASLCLEVIPAFSSTGKRKEHIDSLMSIIDQTATPLGKRSLAYLMLNPMVESEEIKKYYDMVEQFLHTQHQYECLWMYVNKQLSNLPDLARLQRRIALQLINTKEMAQLLKTYQLILGLINTLKQLDNKIINAHFFTHFDCQQFQSFVLAICQDVDINVLESCYTDPLQTKNKALEFTANPFPTLLVDAFQQLKMYEDQLSIILAHFNNVLNHKSAVKMVEKHINKKGKKIRGQVKYETKMTVIVTSNANANKLLSLYDEMIVGQLSSVVHNTTDKVLSSELIDTLLGNYDKLRESIGRCLYQEFDNLQLKILKYRHLFTPICNFVGLLDVIHSYAKVAYKNKYYKPTIEAHGPSFLKVKDLRHPIAEKIIDGEYVSNDIQLGKQNDNDETPFGILLYGLNSVGKSSCLKSVGLVLIMAQAGSYVPGVLYYRPYNKLITRLSTNDNLFKSESSFTVEMTELRTILKQADGSALVLADELASKTESFSAACITVASILDLVEKETSFMISSHIHEIVNFPFLTEMDTKKFKILHLSVEYDEVNDQLIYERKLKPGSGSSRYGINVIKYLKLPQDFIAMCNKISLYLEQQNEEFLSTKKSHFNAKVYMDECYFCQKKVQLQTHHIKEQRNADDLGYIMNMHMNKKDNLVVLCEACHRSIDQRQLQVQHTINGPLLRYK